jgi:hypothetical protein
VSAIDHTTKRATRRELLLTSRVLRERARRLGKLSSSLSQQADELEAEGQGQEGIVLHGRQITDKLRNLVEVGEVLHYTELERRLWESGHLVGGVEPLATLLAAVNRDERFVSVRCRSGRYRLGWA